MMSLNILVLFSSSHEKWALRKIKKLFLGVVVASLGRRLGTLQAAVCRCGRNLESASPFFFFFSSLSPFLRFLHYYNAHSVLYEKWKTIS